VQNDPHVDKLTPPPTASQTVGPFFHLGVAYLTRDNLVPEGLAGEQITLRGRVLDGDGNAVPDALVEIWQADSAGQYHSPASRFQGFGRVETGANGEFSFTTIKPGPVPAPEGSFQAPHIVVTLFARGLLKQLQTRVYFPDEPGNSGDAILKLVPPARRSTLIAARSAASGADHVLEWNIVMQGPGETVFFDY
jgi:protocatechuate 3,4-dioxygenase alpha subunit